ncbi:MAG: FAD-dependent oxidoreductase, partial [Chloroflexi bacterium]|nr:FAD-dependent oxidoreductase [Chloroflexota bacterium]
MLAPGVQVPREYHDVVVAGTGMAGLCAAVAARETGAEVLVVEKAPESNRGGNTRFAGGALRSTGPGYGEEDLYNDIMRITQGRSRPDLARAQAREAGAAIEWLTKLGMEWETELRSDMHAMASIPHWRAKHYPFDGHRGGGNGLVVNMIRIAGQRGVSVAYETKADSLVIDRNRRVIGVRILGKDGYKDLLCRGVVLACGSFNANTEMRVRYIGRFADELIVRGTRFNTGDGIRMAQDIGAQAAGQLGDFHCPVIDARSEKMECGETNINTFPYTIIVNKEGKRYLDEGADWHVDTYAKYGKRTLQEPGGIGFCVFDAKVRKNGLVFGLREQLFPPIEAPTLRELAQKAGIEPASFEKTVSQFNAAVQPGVFDPDKLDGKRTKGIDPPKSNWAQTIDE